MKGSFYLVILFLYIATFSLSFAYEEGASELRGIVVTATPIVEGNDKNRYGSEKTIVSEEQIEDLNAQDLTSALRRTPGVNISKYNIVGSFGGASGGGVFIRGMGSSRPGAEIKTFIDGVPMFMSVWNHPLLDLMSIDPAESIEIYKSPQPYTFGNAFAVVNIVPKVKTTEGFQSKLTISGGSHETYIAKGEHGGKIGRFDYYAGGGYRISDGHRENADGELKDLYVRMGYQLNDEWRLSLFGLKTDNYADDPGIEGKPNTMVGRYRTKAYLGIATIENKYNLAEGYLKFYRNDGDGDWLGQPSSSRQGLKEDLYNNFLFYGMKAREVLRLWEGGEIITGLDWDHTEGDYNKIFSDGSSDNWKGHSFDIVSPYVAISHQFGRKEALHIIPSVGFRYYNHSDFGSEVAPHGGLVVGYNNTIIHLGYAKGILYPGLEVVVVSEKVTPALKTSWKNLEAEKMDHLEAGIRQYLFNKKLDIGVTWFYNEGENRYIVVVPPPPPPYYANIGTYKTKGVELSIAAHPNEAISTFLGINIIDRDPEDLPYAPDVTFSAGINWRFLRNFKLSLDCQYVDKMYIDARARRSTAVNSRAVDSYFLLNGKLSYQLPLPSKQIQGEVFMAVENMTDNHYEYYPGYPMPGITWMVGGKVVF
ncbi:MAG: TonB-dependent receptor [Syntrophobacterales bacterium]|nr:TonB-dependent receptor [Syntrophobacterales bacterium]